MSKTEEQRSGRQKGRLVNSGKLKVESGKLNVHKSDKSDKSDKCISKSSQINILPKQHNVKDLSDLSYLSDFKKKVAFTLSEVLIVIAIIGVISAMTLPSLIKNYQKKVTVERLKSTYSMLYQAVRMSEIDNGILDTWEIPEESTDYEPSKTFGEKYFKPYLKNVRECKKKECFSDVYYLLDGTKNNNNSNIYALALSNSVVISFYPRNQFNLTEIIVDINGKKAPNTYGKDIFHLLLSQKAIKTNYRYFFGIQEKPGLFFYGQGNSINHLKTNAYACSKTEGTQSRGVFCGAWILENGWKIPDDYPW